MADSLKILADPGAFPWIAFVFGLAAGSFLNVVIHRLPKMMEREWIMEIPSIVEESKLTKDPAEAKRLAQGIREQTSDAIGHQFNLILPRSRCPACHHHITAFENIPVLSYFALRGKCSACKTRISLRYPLVEILTGVSFFLSASHFGFSLAVLGAMVFLSCTIAMAFIDQNTGYLPDQITLPLVWVGLLLNLGGTFVPLHEAVIGTVAGYLSLWSIYWCFKLVTGKEGMGYGDFKMNAAVGAFLGWKMLPLVILLSSVVGSVFGILQMYAAKHGWESNFKFHFGPYLAIAGIVAMFWGPQLTRYYLSQIL